MTTTTRNKSITTTIRLDPDELERLREIAEREDRSVASIIRLALRSYLRFKEET
jgi:predicted transcriptional regulator